MFKPIRFARALPNMLFCVMAVLCLRETAVAMLLPHWPIDYVVLKSEVIAQGHFVDKEHFFVEKVFFGNATPQQTIVINDRLNLTRIINDTELVCDPVRAVNNITGKPCRTLGQETAVLFLQKVYGQWEPTAWGSGVKWLLDGKVLGYYQSQNPGPYILIPDVEANSAADLEAAVKRALDKRARFEAALQKTPKQRIVELMPFVEDSKEYLYWKDALRSLAETGPAAGVVLRDLAEKLKGKYQRVEVLKSMGKTGDKENLTPYLLNIMAEAKPSAPAHDADVLSDEQRQTAEEWLAALCSSAELTDTKALPLLRESLSDSLSAGPFYGSQARFCVQEAFNKMPARENVVAYAKVYAGSPQDYMWGTTKWAGWGLLNFLNQHKFPEAVPLLAAQLDHPDELFRDQTHKLLTEIVGNDLGVEKTPWREWYAKHRERSSRVEAP